MAIERGKYRITHQNGTRTTDSNIFIFTEPHRRLLYITMMKYYYLKDNHLPMISMITKEEAPHRNDVLYFSNSNALGGYVNLGDMMELLYGREMNNNFIIFVANNAIYNLIRLSITQFSMYNFDREDIFNVYSDLEGNVVHVNPYNVIFIPGNLGIIKTLYNHFKDIFEHERIQQLLSEHGSLDLKTLLDS